MTVQIDVTKKERGRPRKAQPKEKVTMMMHPVLRERLRDLADRKKLGYQSLAHQILSDAVAQEQTYEKANSTQRLALIAHDVFELHEKVRPEVNKKGSDDPELLEAFSKLQEAAEMLQRYYQPDEDD